MKEIGSEFWTKYHRAETDKADNEAYLLSGRTALRFIIDDISETRKIRKVLMPSYCCQSMIQPFADSGIAIQFYQVNAEYSDYPYDNDADVVFLIDFFGYINSQNAEIARTEKQAGKIIIYDSTHKIDGNASVQEHADYSFCSYRKWFYCNFAKAIKHNGTFNNGVILKSNDRYVDIRDKAAYLKEEYISGIIGQKEEFLSDFSLAEQLLDSDYVGYSGEPVNFAINEIISKRRENAAYLISKLKMIPEIRLWRENIGTADVPLFVPVLVEPSVRNDLRSALIKEKIYCPIHWPKSDYHDKYNELYDTELSLVCDQRYSIQDMERIIRVIDKYFYG